MLVAPLVSKLGERGGFPKMRLLSMALFAWKMFGRVRSVSSFLLRWRKGKRRKNAEDEEAAAAI
jgi:hypothetical protein